MLGNVKFYNGHKGYGFIIGDDNEEYFFSYVDILNKDKLSQGDLVKFDGERERKGLHAKEIIKLDVVKK